MHGVQQRDGKPRKLREARTLTKECNVAAASKCLLLPWHSIENNDLFDTSGLPVWQIHTHIEAIRERQGGVLEAVLRIA